MDEPLDATDREICAALLRNGRASWRQIAQVLDMQERTVARRGARLLDQGIVHVRALYRPELSQRGVAQFARLECAPSELAQVASWFAARPETLWVATLADRSAVISECFIPDESRAQFIEQDLAAQPLSGYSFSYLERYRRTVRGWNPNILSEAQLDALGENESRALLASREDEAVPPIPDATDREIVGLLSVDGRLSIDAIAAELGISKPTARRRIMQLQRVDSLSIRAVINPAFLGFPVEASLVVEAPISRLSEVAIALAEDWHTRWTAEAPGTGRVHALLTAESHVELHATLRLIDQRLSSVASRVSASPILSHYKRSDVIVSRPPLATG